MKSIILENDLYLKLGSKWTLKDSSLGNTNIEPLFIFLEQSIENSFKFLQHFLPNTILSQFFNDRILRVSNYNINGERALNLIKWSCSNDLKSFILSKLFG